MSKIAITLLVLDALVGVVEAVLLFVALRPGP